MNIQDIMNLLPHRYPMLLVDRVEAFKPGESLTAIKNVTINEPFFTGHFPGHPIMPGVLILEALAQATGLYAFSTLAESGRDGSQYLYLFVSIDNARFRRPVVPGDQLRLHVEYISYRRGMLKMKCEASVDGKLAASAEIMCAEQEIKP
jgi:3-hydroxyacyl-[acyl-carrier-protein] dehydratase